MNELVTRSEKQLGEALRRVRKQRGFTQAGLGEKIHMRQATISKLEGGSSTSRLHTLMASLAALDLELVVRPRRRSTGDEIEVLFS